MTGISRYFPMSSAPEKKPAPDDSPGLPGFRTWRDVYGFVLAVFAAVVIALTIFSRVFA
jgi:hypothetical protein